MLRREYFINNPFTVPNIDIHTDNEIILHKMIAALHYFMRAKYGKKGGPSSIQFAEIKS
jgi:hypothetical protein